MTIISMMAVYFFAFSCSLSHSPLEQVNRRLSAAIELEDSDAVAALDLYEETFDILQQYPDSTLLRETYFRMGLLFLRNALPEECITSLNEAARLDSALRDTLSWQKTMRSIAFAYESRGQFELARKTLEKFISQIPDNYSVMYARMDMDCHTRYGELQEKREEMPEPYVYDLDQLTPKSDELELAYRAWQAEYEQNYEYAILLYSRLKSRRSFYVQAFGQLHTARLQMLLGRTEEAARSLNAYEETNGLIRQSEQTTKHLLQHHASYQDRRARREIDRLEMVNRQQWQAIVVGAIICLFVIALLLLVLRLYRQRQTILKFRIEKMRQWREEYLAKSDDDRQKQNVATFQTDIYQDLRRKLNGGDDRPMNSDDWERLQTMVLSAYPAFRHRLSDLCRVSDHDYHVCLLLKIGMKPSDIARLTIHSDEAITSTRRRLYERAFGRKGKPSDWDEIVKAL